MPEDQAIAEAAVAAILAALEPHRPASPRTIDSIRPGLPRKDTHSNMSPPGRTSFPGFCRPSSSAGSSCGIGSSSSRISRRCMADDSMPNDTLRAYFVERARGGAGLIVDGHMTVMVEGMMAPHYIKAWEEDFIPSTGRSSDEVHARGARSSGR